MLRSWFLIGESGPGQDNKVDRFGVRKLVAFGIIRYHLRGAFRSRVGCH